MPIFQLSHKYYLFHPILNFSYKKFGRNSSTDFLLRTLYSRILNKPKIVLYINNFNIINFK